MRRLFTSLSLLLAMLAGPSAAAEVALKPFNASYDLFRGSLHLATTELSLQHQDRDWRWVLETRARGIYAMFTDKQPYAETRFTRFGDSFLVTDIMLGDNGGESHLETARFDWEQGRLEVLRKGKQSEMRLGDEVYDYQSIHLLAASMWQSQIEQATLNFYRKGKLLKARLDYKGQQAIEVDGQSVDANVYELLVSGSRSRVKYFYDSQNPLLPLRIESRKDGESASVLSLRSFDWQL